MSIQSVSRTSAYSKTVISLFNVQLRFLRNHPIITLTFSLLLFLPIFSPLQAEQPWGKDSALCYTSPAASHTAQLLPFANLAQHLIYFHKAVISPADGPRSHFIPSSSLYTLNAIRKYGFGRGFLLGCDRLMRENDEPWIYPLMMGPYGPMKWDPVK